MINQIPQYEFTQRVKTLQEKMIQEKLDIIITFGDEAEPQYVRYFSDYWPSFESAGVFIPKTGEPSLLIGPESYTFSKAWSKIPRILKLKEYRESSEPEYPGVPLTTFTDLFNEVIDTSSFRRIGIVGYPLMPTPVYEAITKTAQDFRCEVVRAEKLIIGMKQIKSETEIEIMHNAYNISQKSFANVLKKIQPGMSEIEVVAESEYFIRKFGAENEAYPMWCISGENTTHAIARPTPKEAINIAQKYTNNIHLLITDVVMPDMSGPELTERLLTIFPNIKVLFMSGYTANVIAHQGVLDEGVHFIQKPFLIKDLGTKVRSILENID
jgi:Xaa-Pro aminopeptidase